MKSPQCVLNEYEALEVRHDVGILADFDVFNSRTSFLYAKSVDIKALIHIFR
jgi:hypothetical protein